MSWDVSYVEEVKMGYKQAWKEQGENSKFLCSLNVKYIISDSSNTDSIQELYFFENLVAQLWSHVKVG